MAKEPTGAEIDASLGPVLAAAVARATGSLASVKCVPTPPPGEPDGEPAGWTMTIRCHLDGQGYEAKQAIGRALAVLYLRDPAALARAAARWVVVWRDFLSALPS